MAAFTGGSLLIGTVGRPDLVEPRLTEELARAQHASAHRLADRLEDAVSVLPTHGFGSFCSSTAAGGEHSTIGAERAANPALVQDAETFVRELLAGLDDVPAYYAHMAPVNSEGPAPLDLTEPRRADADEIARRLAAGEWVVDLRSRVAFAAGHVAGSLNFEADGQLATYLAWLIPWGRPVTLLAHSADDLARAQRELARVGIDRPAAAAVGSPADWVAEGSGRPRSGAPPSPSWPRRDGTARTTWWSWTYGGPRNAPTGGSGAACTCPSTRSTGAWTRCRRARCGCTARAGCARRSPRPCWTPPGARWSRSTTASPRRPGRASRS